MCRLAYVPQPFEGITKWFRQMERSAGGDGTGIAIGKHLKKGVKMCAEGSALEMAKILGKAKRQRRKLLPTLWHSRRTSCGDDLDILCHPFACDGGHLAHNGHWEGMAARARQAGATMSDTRLFSVIIDDAGFTSSVLAHTPPGVWLHMLHDGRLAIWKNGGSLWRDRDSGIVGSEPPDGARLGSSWSGWDRVEDGFYDYGEHMGEPFGKEPAKKPAAPAKVHEVKPMKIVDPMCLRQPHRPYKVAR